MACDNQELWAAINRASAEREVLMEAVAMLKVKVAQLEAAAKPAEGRTGYPFEPYTEFFPAVQCDAGEIPKCGLRSVTVNSSSNVITH